MRLIYFTGRELRQRETKAQMRGDAKMPCDTDRELKSSVFSFLFVLFKKRKNKLVQYPIEMFQHRPR